jgi:P-type Cu2+ transporter
VSCCAPPLNPLDDGGFASVSSPDIRAESRDIGNGVRQIALSVPQIHCGACIGTIEGAVAAMPSVRGVRVNLTARRMTFDYAETATDQQIEDVIARMAKLGYAAHTEGARALDDPEFTRLIRALGVAGFSAMNIMLLSVSVWSGAEGATRDLFHWISALIAAPTILYSGRVFYASAFNALASRRLNMDVPIALAITLAFLMSLHQVGSGAEHAWFDAPVSLLFFLLAGRTADHYMRMRARGRISGLRRLMSKGAIVINSDGTRSHLTLDAVRPGMTLFIAAGERVPVDGTVISGSSDVDRSIVTGEAASLQVGSGSALESGVLNLTGPLTLEATADSASSFLSTMEQMVDEAGAAQGTYRRIADRAAQLYSPVVHITALASLIGWKLAGADWSFALEVTVATLIITCPCALGLAVPMVHAVAAGRLSKSGVLLKDAAALERLAGIDSVVFDKTGTLTSGSPEVSGWTGDADALGHAALLAASSNHPYARGVALAFTPSNHLRLGVIREVPGSGVEARDASGRLWRFGSPGWALAAKGDLPGAAAVVLSCDGRLSATFRFQERLRAGAAAAMTSLQKIAGLKVRIASGDDPERVGIIAARLGVETFEGRLKPADKIALIGRERALGHKVLMVGDGINDAPALAAADVSMAPASASDIGRSASSLVFLNQSLLAVADAVMISRRANRLVLQNFALAIGYNIFAVPLAIAGYATPLLAAVAMSTSSIIVVANAMRLAAWTSPVASGVEAVIAEAGRSTAERRLELAA